jgi:hypothetical protein
MQNNVQIYERRYNNLFDVFSEIGGVIQFIFYLFYWINYAYNRYIIAFNINSLFFSIRDQNIIKERRRNNIFDKKVLNQQIFLESFIQAKEKTEEQNLESNDIGNDMIKMSNDNNNQNKDGIELVKNIAPSKNKTLFYTNQNSRNFFLKDNNKSLGLIKNKLRKENYSFIDLYKKLDINNKAYQKNKKVSDKKNIGHLIRLSRGSLAKIEHTERKIKFMLDDKLKDIIYFSFLDFLKSLLFKNHRNNHTFIAIFRKHLLSEEHLLKSHIKMIFLEKKCKFDGNENSNFLECFNEL